MEPIGFNTRIEQHLSELFLELLANGITQLLPFLQCPCIKLKAIGHPAQPSRAEEQPGVHEAWRVTLHLPRSSALDEMAAARARPHTAKLGASVRKG